MHINFPLGIESKCCMCKPLSVRLCAHACLQPSLTETIHILWYNVFPTNYFQILFYNLIFWIFGSDISHLRNVSIHVYAYGGLHLYLYVSRLIVGNFVFVHVDSMFRFRCISQLYDLMMHLSHISQYTIFGKTPIFLFQSGILDRCTVGFVKLILF